MHITIIIIIIYYYYYIIRSLKPLIFNELINIIDIIQSQNRQNSKDSVIVNCQQVQWPALINQVRR